MLFIEGLDKIFKKLNYRILISPKVQLGGKFPDIIGIKGKEIVAIGIKNHAAEITKAIGLSLIHI